MFCWQGQTGVNRKKSLKKNTVREYSLVKKTLNYDLKRNRKIKDIW